MRFTWFNLMPWPYLPEDFREQNRSVWVDISGNLFDPVKGHTLYNDYMDLLEYAGAVGFDGIGVNEHHQNGYGLMPSPNLIAAGLARRTDHCAIVVLGASICALQSAAEGGRGIFHAGLSLRRPTGGGVSRGDFHGYELLLWYDPRSDA